MNSSLGNRRASLLVILVLSVTFLFLLHSTNASAETRFVIMDDATGGACPSIGQWDPQTKTCTLTRDLFVEAIDIGSGGLTLDGNGHSISDDTLFPTSGAGIRVSGKTGVTIRNTRVLVYPTGIHLESSSGSLIENNYCMANGSGEFSGDGTGIFLWRSNNNVVRNNVVDHSGSFFTEAGEGIRLNASHGNSLLGNIIDYSFRTGLDVSTSDNNIIQRNLISNSSYIGFGLTGSNNIVTGNTLDNSLAMINFAGAAGSNNQIYHNNFLGLPYEQINYDNSPGNIFNMPAAGGGGNYWANYDSPAEGCFDLNADGFCDAPFLFYTQQDQLPLTSPAACDLKPGLGFAISGVRWASYADYLNRLLTVDFGLSNPSGPAALDVTVMGATASNGVTTSSTLPVNAGDMAIGSATAASLSYHVPAGVNYFRTQIYATAQDVCGSSYDYPGPYPGI